MAGCGIIGGPARARTRIPHLHANDARMLKDAIDLHRQGRFDEAEKGYRARLAEQPDDVEALHLLGMLRYQLGDTPEGSTLLQRAHALAPEDAGIELTLASMSFREGDHEAARRGFHAALALDPNLAGAHAGLGQLALMRGEQAVAEQHFRTALRNGEEPHALAGLGGLLLERGDLDAALRHLGRAADLAPNDAMIQFMLGQAFARRDTPAFAEQAFRNALRIKPDLHQVRPWLGSVLLKEIGRLCLEGNFAVIRVDTHRDNRTMQRLLRKNGFCYCGIIYLEDKSERLAFEKILRPGESSPGPGEIR